MSTSRMYWWRPCVSLPSLVNKELCSGRRDGDEVIKVRPNPLPNGKRYKKLSVWTNDRESTDKHSWQIFVLLASHWTGLGQPEVIQLKNMEWKFRRQNEADMWTSVFHDIPLELPPKTSSIDKFERLARWHTKTRYWLKVLFAYDGEGRWPTFPRLIICVSGEISPATRDTESFFRNYHKNRTVPIFHRVKRETALFVAGRKSRPRRRQKCKD